MRNDIYLEMPKLNLYKFISRLLLAVHFCLSLLYFGKTDFIRHPNICVCVCIVPWTDTNIFYSCIIFHLWFCNHFFPFNSRFCISLDNEKPFFIFYFLFSWIKRSVQCFPHSILCKFLFFLLTISISLFVGVWHSYGK